VEQGKTIIIAACAAIPVLGNMVGADGLIWRPPGPGPDQ
jgi:hypothetical protein